MNFFKSNGNSNSNSDTSSSSSNNTSNDIKPEKKDYKHIDDPFRIHRLTCENNIEEIKKCLDSEPYYKEFIDIRDTHGYSATHYAAHFGYKNIIELLLKYGADPTKKSAAGWSVIQEACGRKDREIVTLLLQQIKNKIENEFTKRMPILVSALENIPDFEMELKWEVKSWVPLVTRFCPYDTYKIYKQGSSFRVDTSIIGMDGIKFIRGDLSFLYKSQRLFSMDSIKHTYSEMEIVASKNPKVHDEEVDILLDQTMNRVKLMTDEIVFTKSKTWFGNEKTEKIGDNADWSAKMFDVTNVDLKIMARKPKRQPNHPNFNKDQQQLEDKDSSSDDNNDNKITTNIDDNNNNNNNDEDELNQNPIEQTKKYIESLKNVTYEIRESTLKSKIMEVGYFKAPKDFDPYTHEQNINKSKIKTQGLLCDGETVSERHKYFKGTIWISEEFPRKVTDLLPIFEVLSPTNKLFSRLCEFISLKLPSDGFPVKLDLPLFPTISATVIFTKYIEKPVDKNLFTIPSHYIVKTTPPSSTTTFTK
ncbi:hypothetical protein ACTFIW_003053 [Dictyostelium discoideum]